MYPLPPHKWGFHRLGIQPLTIWECLLHRFFWVWVLSSSPVLGQPYYLAAVTSTQISWVYLLLDREKATLEMHMVLREPDVPLLSGIAASDDIMLYYYCCWIISWSCFKNGFIFNFISRATFVFLAREGNTRIFLLVYSKQASLLILSEIDRNISENHQVMLMYEWRNVMSSQWSMFGREFCRQRNQFMNKLREAKLRVKLVRGDCHCL